MLRHHYQQNIVGNSFWKRVQNSTKILFEIENQKHSNVYNCVFDEEYLQKIFW